MEPSFRYGDSAARPSEPSQQAQRPRRSAGKRLLRFIKRYWYIIAILIIVIGGLVTWRTVVASQDAAWKRATDDFAKADYENAAKELAPLGVPTDKARLQVYAQTMLATRNLPKALIGYQKLYDQTKDPATKLIIGNIYNQQQNYDDAISVYKEVIADNKNNIQAYVNLATVYKLKGSDADAIKIAQQAVSNNPSSTVALELLVSLLVNDKTSDAYTQAVDQLKKLNPNDPLLQSLNA